MTTTLTPAQTAALLAVPPMHSRDAATIGAHPSTLTALATRGLVERRWTASSLRGGEHWTYRLSSDGLLTAGRIRRG